MVRLIYQDVDDIFEHCGKTYKCVEQDASLGNSCNGCDMPRGLDKCGCMLCEAHCRFDEKAVIFKEVKKND